MGCTGILVQQLLLLQEYHHMVTTRVQGPTVRLRLLHQPQAFVKECITRIQVNLTTSCGVLLCHSLKGRPL